MGIEKVNALAERSMYGINSVSAVNRKTGKPYGEVAIVGTGTLSLTASSVDLKGGSSFFAHATEITDIDSQVTFNLRTWPDWVFEVFFGARIKRTDANATGQISDFGNYVGTSVSSLITGISSVNVKSGESPDLKSGWYVISAISATTVHVYRTSSFESNLGQRVYFNDDNLRITTDPLTVVTGSPVSIPGVGLELEGGSSIAMNVGDAAIFQVSRPHSGISDIDLGSRDMVIPEVELHMVGRRRSSGETAMIRCYKAQAVSGMTIPFSLTEYAQTDLTMKLLHDRTEDKIGTIRFTEEIN